MSKLKWGGPTAYDKLRLRLAAEQAQLCAYCMQRFPLDPRGYPGAMRPLVTLEHIVPRAAGGRNDEDNLVAACSSCNGRKGSLSLLIFLAQHGDRIFTIRHKRLTSRHLTVRRRL